MGLKRYIHVTRNSRYSIEYLIPVHFLQMNVISTSTAIKFLASPYLVRYYENRVATKNYTGHLSQPSYSMVYTPLFAVIL